MDGAQVDGCVARPRKGADPLASKRSQVSGKQKQCFQILVEVNPRFSRSSRRKNRYKDPPSTWYRKAHFRGAILTTLRNMTELVD